MTNHQIAKNKMYKKVLAFFAIPANAAIWAAFARLVTEIANFVALNGTFDNATQTQEQNIRGLTEDKEDDFHKMVALAVSMAFKGYVWAVDNSNNALAEVFNVQLSDFDHLAESVAFDKVKNIRKGINDNIGSMASVNLLPADVTALDGLITNYTNTQSAPGVARADKKTSTKEIADLQHPIDASLGLISRLLISQYSATNSAMVESFRNVKHIDDLPVHHTGIHIHITDAATGEDLEGATLSIPAAGKTSTSDMDGIAEIIKIKPDEYHVTVSAPNFTPQTFKTKIDRGRIAVFEIKLAAGSGGGGGGVSAIREGDVPFPGIVSVPYNGINGTPQTTMTVLMTLAPGRAYAGAAVTDIPGPVGTFLDFQAGVPVTLLADALVALIGLGPAKPLLLIQNIGMVTAHYKITFDNLQSK